MSDRMIRGSDSEQSEEKAGVELVPGRCAPQTIMCKGPGVSTDLMEDHKPTPTPHQPHMHKRLRSWPDWILAFQEPPCLDPTPGMDGHEAL